jgi:hypothetical protein
MINIIQIENKPHPVDIIYLKMGWGFYIFLLYTFYFIQYSKRVVEGEGWYLDIFNKYKSLCFVLFVW